MIRSFLVETFRRNWHSLIALAMCVAVALAFAGWRAETPPPIAAGAQPRAAIPPQAPTPAPTEKRLTPAEGAARSIEQHRAEYDADPKGERAPSLLLSIGNLYLQKMNDLESAIATYEQLIAEHPDWEGIRKAYVQLGDAYEKDRQPGKAASVYEEMTQQFPPDSVEFDYATRRLEAGVGAE